MEHRIAAGALIEHEGRLLLVRCCEPNEYDFWVAPGGGVQGAEDLHAAVVREVREECGLVVEVGPLAYIEDLLSPGQRHCKLWFAARVLGGELSTTHEEALKEHIVEVAWLDSEALRNRRVFPPVLLDRYWEDRTTGFAFPRYLGVREMLFP